MKQNQQINLENGESNEKLWHLMESSEEFDFKELAEQLIPRIMLYFVNLFQ